MSVAAVVVLTHGVSRCDIYPGIGGSVGRWSIGNQELLRRAMAEAIAAADPFGMSTFPLVPYSNRIGHASFKWNGKCISLRPNFGPEPHAIHGVGWKRAWRVTEQLAETATLTLVHEGDEDWPWAFTAEQIISIEGNELTIILRATNNADTPVPLAFGHHPYFDQQGATLTFDADTVWESGDDSLPTTPVRPAGQFDFSAASPVAGRDVDHCYTGVEGTAKICWTDRSYSIEMMTTPHLTAAVIYVPEGGDAFCFEPVPHVNNALNMPDVGPAMAIVDPGERVETRMIFRAHAK